MFADRQEAGVWLTKIIKKPSGKTIVCGITRGGVVVALPIARFFKLPLYPFVVKKIGAVNNPELAVGALTYNKTSFFDWDLIKKLAVSDLFLKEQTEKNWQAFAKLASQFKTKPPVKNNNIILVDDGVATGTTVRAAIKYLKQQKAKEIILAVPVIASDIYKKLKTQVTHLYAVKLVDDLVAVGQFYRSFPQVKDQEVLTILS